MLDELKSKLGNEIKEYMSPQKVGDIYENDKLAQAEKRFQKYLENNANGYFPFLGSFFLFICSFGAISIYTEEGGSFISLMIGVLLVILSFWIIYLGYKQLPRYKRLPNYFTCIADSKNGSLDNIAIALGYPYETVVADIELLINKGILEKTFINHSKRLITSPLIGETISKDSRSVSCPNCGATNQIIGQTTECEFCGSTLR